MATGGNSDHRRFEWMATLGGMVKHGTIVTAMCDRCGRTKLADMNKLLEALGPEGSLLDRHPPCWRRNCDGQVLFHAGLGRSTPSRPCITAKGAIARWRRERDRKDYLKSLRNG